MSKQEITFIDLFAGIGGTRIGLEKALRKNGFKGKCVFTSEIKPHAISAYKNNFDENFIAGDITEINAKDLPDFEILLAGFPCQPFSSAGVRRGFLDTRGTLFFDIERIIKEKKPKAFLLENVEGLVLHDRTDVKKPTGRTLETILKRLDNLGYTTEWKVINASDHGSPQNRKRVYITGTRKNKVNLENLPVFKSTLSNILEKSVDDSLYINSKIAKKLLNTFSNEDLWGKQIKDKRGGPNNIHSWDIGIKGKIIKEQKNLLEELLKQRRRKTWAIEKNIKWMDGIPLTLQDIETFYSFKKTPKFKSLKEMLNDLIEKGYLVKEMPKTANIYDNHLNGYNIVVGKLSFDISHILHPSKQTPTLVATDVTRLSIVDEKGLRRLSVREGLRLFGFPEEYIMNKEINYNKVFDLLGNSVCVNIIELVSDRIIKALDQ